MAKFLEGNDLNAELDKLILTADSFIALISPYIKLHERYKSSLLTHVSNPKFELVVVFGKNEQDISKSIRKEDFAFLGQFPNLQIKYEPRLHAKFYANDSSAILTSMNLYDFSQNNNIEAGVLTESSLLGGLAGSITGMESLDRSAANYFERVVTQAELVYAKEPIYESGALGLTKKFKGSRVVVDKLSARLGIEQKAYSVEKAKGTINAQFDSKKVNRIGYCIRTGREIPFDPKRPLSDEAYKSWNRFKNPDYAEKFCHYSGELSNGETSVSKPILRKNWNAAKAEYNL